MSCPSICSCQDILLEELKKKKNSFSCQMESDQIQISILGGVGRVVTESEGIVQIRPRRWSIFQSDGMVNVFFQATIDFNGFSMVLIPLDHHH